MKCLVVSHSSGLAGAEKSLIALSKELVRRGHYVEAWVPQAGPLQVELIGIGVGSIRVVPNHWWLSRRGGGLVGVLRLFQIVADAILHLLLLGRSDFDVVFVNSIVAPAAIFGARFRKIPCVVTVRESFKTNPTLRGILPKTAIAHIVSFTSTRVVCISEYVAKQFSYPCDIVNPPVSRDVSSLRTAIDPTNFTALRAVMLGTIGGDKGQSDAIKALTLARSQGVDVELDIYGSGVHSEVVEIDRLIIKLGMSGAVRRHAPTSDSEKVLSQADLSLVASRNEAFGRVTVESLLVGTPVLGYDCGGTSEILRGQGGGLLVPPDYRQLAEALVDFCQNPKKLTRLAEEAGTAGRLWSRKHADAEMVDILEEAESQSRISLRNIR